jgi:hypothetical protein
VSLKHSYLQIRGQICRLSTQQPITEDDEVGLENLPLQTLWNQVDLSLQQKVINSRVGTNHAYKAYLDVLLNNSPDMMKNQLTSQLFVKDVAKTFDSAINSGYRARKKYTDRGKEVELEGPLYLDIGQQERPIINGVEINLRFWPNKASFCLSSTLEDYFFKINDAVLNVCVLEVSPAILLGHAAALKEASALYPYMQSDFKAFSIPKGQYEYSIDNIFQGDVPSDLVVGLVSSRSYNGAYNKNPFNFHNFDCSYCGFFINSISTPSQPFQPIYYNSPVTSRPRRLVPSDQPEESSEDLTRPSEREGTRPSGRVNVDVNVERSNNNNAYVNSYLSLFGQRYHTSGNIPIALDEYPYGYCLYKFQVNENATEEGNGEFVTLARRGHTRLTLKFRKPLPESVTVITYAHFPRILQIDEARNINA